MKNLKKKVKCQIELRWKGHSQSNYQDYGVTHPVAEIKKHGSRLKVSVVLFPTRYGEHRVG